MKNSQSKFSRDKSKSSMSMSASGCCCGDLGESKEEDSKQPKKK